MTALGPGLHNSIFFPTTNFKLVGMEATKDWKGCGMLRTHLFGTFHS